MTLGRGDLVGGRYRVIERIGNGACAQVYLAEEPGADGRRVALKVFRAGDDGAAALPEQLDLLQSLEQPNLVRVLGHGTLPGDGAPYLVMEWVDGADLLEAARLLPMSRLRGLLVQLCHGLSFLHEKGVVHGSLKPSNLRVTRGAGEEDCWTLKILDFGQPRPADSEAVAALLYTAPETLRQDEVDGRADLYALGVLLYQMLTGALPFDSSDTASILRGHLEETARPIDTECSGAPADLAEVTARLLMKDPEDRFASASELAKALAPRSEPEVGVASVSDVRLPSLVGRGREVKELQAFLDPRQDGAGLALILGEGGIGKSRLLAQLVDMARERNLPVLQGACHETGGAPFGAFLEVLEWAAAAAETEDLTCTPTDEDTVVGLAERFGPEVVKVVPRAFRREVLPSPELQPRYERVRLIDAVGTFLLEVSKAKPFVLTVEDLHWADDASADLVEYLLRNRARGRLALAAAARPFENRAEWLKESLENEGGPGSVLRLVLERLDLDAVADLARSALRLPNPPHDLATHLLRETAGNPFFVVEMLRDLVEDGGLRRQDGTWCWNESALRRRPRPASMAQALERRLARVGDGELQLLQALALLDRAVERELLERVAAASPRSDAATPDDIDWAPQLERLLDRGLVVRLQEESRERFAVAHDAMRELVERGMNWETRQSIHTAAGTILEEIHGEGAEEAIERIAYHFIQAADDERSARYCVQAAKKARRLYANEEASYFFLQALKYYPDPADPVRWDALGSLGEVYVLQGKMAEARTRYEEMRKLAEAAGHSGHTAAANLGLAEVARCLSDYGQQISFARVAYRLALKAGLDAAQADALQVLGLAHYNLGRFYKAIRCYSLALDLLTQTGDVRIASNVLNRMGLAFMSRGDMKRAKELFEEALSVAQTNDLRIRSSVHNNLGCIAENEGRYTEAISRYSSAEAIAQEWGDRYYMTLSVLNRASALIRLNAIQEAEEQTRRALRLAVELGEKLLQCYLTVFQGQIRRVRKEYDDAASYIDEARRNARRIGHLEIRLIADLEWARLLLDRGQTGEAAELCEAIWQEATDAIVPEVAAHASSLAAESHRKLDNTEKASAFLQRAWSVLDGKTYPEASWHTHLTAGQLCEQLEKYDDASSHYRAGAAILDQVAAAIEVEDLRDAYLREPRRLELRVKAATALRRQVDQDPSRSHETRPWVCWAEAMADLSQSLVGLSTIEEISRTLIAAAVRLFGAERGAVIVGQGSSGSRVVAEFPENGPLQSRLWPCRIVEQGHAGKRGVSNLDDRAVAVAMDVPNDAPGVLCLLMKDPSAFGPTELRLLEAMAAQAALASSAGTSRTRISRLEETEVETFGDMIALSPSLRHAFAQLRRLSRTEESLLIEGESGTGKELAARAVHDASPRGDGPFIAIDCGAVPESLVEAELFGCRKGAYSGANETRKGLISLANNGTLFLDEVGNMPLMMQAKLLRVLQTGDVRPLGMTSVNRVDFRVVSATNEDLGEAVRSGRFRQDLYYRIAGLSIALPPLRERPEDIRVLVNKILQEAKGKTSEQPKTIADAALTVLQDHAWPGNVRELENVVRVAVALASSDVIVLGDLPAYLLADKGHGNVARGTRRQADLEELEIALQKTGGDKTAAARLLGWSRMRVYRVLRRAERPLNMVG